MRCSQAARLTLLCCDVMAMAICRSLLVVAASRLSPVSAASSCGCHHSLLGPTALFESRLRPMQTRGAPSASLSAAQAE